MHYIFDLHTPHILKEKHMKRSSFLSLYAIISIASVHIEKAAAADVLPPPNDKEWYASGGTNGYYKQANDLQNNQQYTEAIQAYDNALEKKLGNERDQKMALLNKAACQTSQGEPGLGWKEYDWLWRKSLSPEKQQELMNKELPRDLGLLRGKTVRVDEAGIGIGDDFHFFKLLEKLKERGCNVVMVMSKGFLEPTFQGAATKAGITLVKAKDPKAQEFDYQTHLFALLGHLKVRPQELRPTEVMHWPLKRDDGSDPVDLVRNQINSILHKDKDAHVMFVQIGEATRPGVVPGGKELYDRHIDPDAINNALRTFENLHIIDLGAHDANTRFNASKDVANRVIPIEKEENPFDTLLAAGIILREQPRTSLLYADTGPGNATGSNVGGICPDVITPAAERSVAVVPGQHDWRVNGDEKTSEDYKAIYVADQDGNKEKIGDIFGHRVAASLVYITSRRHEKTIVARAISYLIEKGTKK